MDLLIDDITINFNKRLMELKTKLEYLRNEEESKYLMLKLEKLHPQFIYNCFSEVFTGFKSIDEAERTCSVLIQTIFDGFSYLNP